MRSRLFSRNATLLLGGLALIAAWSCRNTGGSPSAASAQLICKTLRAPSEEMPLTTVSVSAFGDTYTVDTVPVCAVLKPEAYAQYGVPAEALSAAGGWYAGSGDYFYLLPAEDGDILVFQGWQDEEQSDEGYHYRAILRIKPVR